MITKLISHNPYRILGVYSNSPKKDVLSNLNKMKAFLKVGKIVSFPLDLPQFLPSIERDEAIVSSAQTSIELPMDQIKHTLFWFMKATPLDDIAINNLLAGNMVQAKEIWNKKETVSSLLNLMACALIEADFDSLAIKADTLFQNYSEDFCLAVNETIKLTSSQLTELFIELIKQDGTFELARLMQVSDTSVEWRKIIGGGLVKPIIDEISLAISEAQSAKGSSANYRAGEKLMNSTKGVLSQLRNLLGVSDMQYQMIADKLASTILQCGINYFNDTEEDYAVEKAMRLQNYALSIAVGQMAIDRCKENVDVLKNIGPEFKVRKELKRISERLNTFSNKLPKKTFNSFSNWLPEDTLPKISSDHLLKISFHDIEYFINICKPDILLIKEKLTQNDSLYKKVSSSVVSVAINAVVLIINESSKRCNDNIAFSLLYEDQMISRFDLEGDIKKALKIMTKLSSFSMSDECKEYYLSNKSALKRISKQLHPSGGCYIATMAYGAYDHPQVMVLRQFRDSYLSNRGWGRKFISFYYANSPHWVEVLKSHKHINALIRKALDSFVSLLKKTSHYE